MRLWNLSTAIRRKAEEEEAQEGEEAQEEEETPCTLLDMEAIYAYSPGRFFFLFFFLLFLLFPFLFFLGTNSLHSDTSFDSEEEAIEGKIEKKGAFGAHREKSSPFSSLETSEVFFSFLFFSFLFFSFFSTFLV